MAAEHLVTDPDRTGSLTSGAVRIGIEPFARVWVWVLLTCGYQVYAISRLRQAARDPQRHCTSEGRSDAGDAEALAESAGWIGALMSSIAGYLMQVEVGKLLA